MRLDGKRAIGFILVFVFKYMYKYVCQICMVSQEERLLMRIIKKSFIFTVFLIRSWAAAWCNQNLWRSSMRNEVTDFSCISSCFERGNFFHIQSNMQRGRFVIYILKRKTIRHYHELDDSVHYYTCLHWQNCENCKGNSFLQCSKFRGNSKPIQHPV